ncbi:DUF2079 domain-containing protein [Jatrophihabitans sp. DSM 45814]
MSESAGAITALPTAVGPAAEPRRRRWLRYHLQRWPLWLLCISAFVVYSLTALLRNRQFGTAGYDLGIFDQAVRNYAHFRAPIVALKGPGYNIFGDHFHPIIALAAPLYWIWDDPRTLLVLQAGLIAASIPVVYRFARRRTNEWASLAIGFAYAFSWAIQTMVNFDFHEVAWGVPILALAIDALDREDDRQLFIFAGLLLLVREDMGILLLLIGFLRIFRRPRWPAIVIIVAGVAMYEIATSVILPHFSPSGQFAYWQYGPTLGPDLSSAIKNTLTKPWHTVHLFFVPWVKTRTLLLLVVPLAFLPFRSRYSLLALPLLAQRFFEPAERYRLWEPGYHYNALPWVILVLAMIDGADRLHIWAHARLTAALCVFLVACPIVITAANRNVAVLHDVFSGKLFKLDSEMRAQAATVAQIPRDVCVEADDRLAGHLTDRDYVTIPGLEGYRSDFVALDLSQKDVGGNNGPKPAAVFQTALNHGYRVVFSDGDLRLLQSPNYTGPSSQCKPMGSGK